MEICLYSVPLNQRLTFAPIFVSIEHFFQEMHMTLHTISVLVENKFGALTRIAGLFSGRGYNIHSLNVAPSEDSKFSRMTIVVDEQEETLNQIIKQLNKLVNVVDVIDFRQGENVFREIILLRVGVTKETRSEIVDLCNIFHARVVDATKNTFSIEISGGEFRLGRFLSLIRDYDVQMIVRSGRIAIPKPQD